VFQDGGRLAQFARPTELLAQPANTFVSDFLGPERELKRLALIPVTALEAISGPTVTTTDRVEHARQVAHDHASDRVIVLDTTHSVLGWLSLDRLESDRKSVV